MLHLTSFKNSRGVFVGDLYLDDRRLLATTHPATVVAAIYAMDLTTLKVTSSTGTHTANLEYRPDGDETLPLPIHKMRMDLNPAMYQYGHLASYPTEKVFLEGLDLFSNEDWHDTNEIADEHLRTAHHHLPPELIARPLTKPAGKTWKKTLRARNQFVYYPFC